MKTCKDCQHYVKHYICTDYHGYREVNGHCRARSHGNTMDANNYCSRFIERDCEAEQQKKCEKVRGMLKDIDYKLQKLVEFIEKCD